MMSGVIINDIEAKIIVDLMLDIFIGCIDFVVFEDRIELNRIFR